MVSAEAVSSRRLSPGQAARLKGLSYSTIVKLIESRDLPAIDVSRSDSSMRQWRIKPSDLDEWESRRMNALAGGAA